MGFGWLRRRLGVVATLWLCGQAVTLSAFAANLCCLDMPAEPFASHSGSHHHGSEASQAAATAAGEHAGHTMAAADAKAADTDCPEAVVDLCAMTGASGEPCPMHAGKPSAASTSSAAADCIMSATCDATDIALLAFLWAPGVLVPATSPFIVLTSQPISLQADTTFSSSPSVDTPPPRA